MLDNPNLSSKKMFDILAGGKDISKIPDAIAAVPEIIGKF